MASTSVDKIIFTNLAVLRAKYGAAGLAAVKGALGRLAAADKARGLRDLVVDLSSATVSRYGATPIPAADAGNEKANKDAIDQVFASFAPLPSYLVLLGAPDVIPHVSLANLIPDDEDADVPSDLPYACDHAYSTNVQDFTAPTRVVGRLPNVRGDRSADYLVRLIDVAAGYTSSGPALYAPYFGVSASVWQKSTQLSLNAVFGHATDLRVVPPDTYKWGAARLAKRLAHFVNCHGASGTPEFYGQKGSSYPVAHAAKWMATRVLRGTVMAAECCYGAELYDPSVATAQGQMGLCNTYLGRGAYAWFGSSTIAYGPATTNDQADLLCQYFLQGILAGASAGRACLQAKLRYVTNKSGVLSPTDLKTLAQFNLLADPAVTPVKIASPSVTTAGSAPARHLVERYQREDRRLTMIGNAQAAPRYRLTGMQESPSTKSASVAKLRRLAGQHGFSAPEFFVSHVLEGPPSANMSAAAKSMAAGPGLRKIHTVLKRLDAPADVPHLRLVQGMQVIEYADAADVRLFQSR